MNTIDISDLCTDTLNLSESKDFKMYRDAVVKRLSQFLLSDIEYEDLLLKLETTDTIDTFLEEINNIDTYLANKNIHFITCL